MQANYKVNKGLVDACQAHIIEYNCLDDEEERSHMGKLSHILLCLEGVQREGKK